MSDIPTPVDDAPPPPTFLKRLVVALFLLAICAPAFAVATSPKVVSVVAAMLRDPSQNAVQVEILRRSTPLWTKAVEVYNTLLYRLRTSPNPNYGALGQDGWILLGDANNHSFSQSIHRLSLQGDQITEWAGVLDDEARWLARHHIPMVFVVAPSQLSVYPEKAPRFAAPWMPRPSSFDEVLAAKPTLPLLDLRPALKEGRAIGETYSPMNSHWSDLGGYVAWQQIAKRLESVLPGFKPFGVDDLAGIEHVPDYFSEYRSMLSIDAPNPWDRYILKTPFPDYQILGDAGRVAKGSERTGLLDLPRQTLNPNATSNLKVMVLRDSMGDAISPFLQASFRETVQLNHHYTQYPKDRINLIGAVERYKPDVVVYIMTERYFEQPLGNFYYWYSVDTFDNISPAHDLVWSTTAGAAGPISVSGDLTLDQPLVVHWQNDGNPRYQNVVRLLARAGGYGAVRLEFKVGGKATRVTNEYWEGNNELYFQIPATVDDDTVTLVKDYPGGGPLAVSAALVRQHDK